MLSDLNMCTQEPIALNQTLRKCSFEVNLSYPTSQGLADFFYFTDGRQFTGTAGNLCTYDSEPTSWQNMESHGNTDQVSIFSFHYQFLLLVEQSSSNEADFAAIYLSLHVPLLL